MKSVYFANIPPSVTTKFIIVALFPKYKKQSNIFSSVINAMLFEFKREF